MSPKLIQLKTYLGKYSNISPLEKYTGVKFDDFLHQSFFVQDNDPKLYIDSSLEGLQFKIIGNEFYISAEMFDHPNISITNSMESDVPFNRQKLYSTGIFSSIAYLIAFNFITIRIDGKIDKPIFAHYKSEFEKFYNCVVSFSLQEGSSAEIIEEIESCAALNIMTNYIIGDNANLQLYTFYQNIASANSFLCRNIITDNNSSYNHLLYGKSSAIVLDETNIHAESISNIKLEGHIKGKNFNSVINMYPPNKRISVNYNESDYSQSLSSNIDFIHKEPCSYHRQNHNRFNSNYMRFLKK